MKVGIVGGQKFYIAERMGLNKLYANMYESSIANFVLGGPREPVNSTGL